MQSNKNIKFIQGNEAIAEGAIAAGARFYAGYPITPSSEVAEVSSIKLPQVGGLYVQMEDEIGSMAAIIGGSLSGKKSYTATSGPGFSLMQENLGVAVMAEVPCVIINVQRSGPSTGLATKPAQGDFMQSKWGSHGDYGIIAISPSSVQDCYDLAITAFNLAEKYRTPVIFLADEIVGHMKEKVNLWEPEEKDIVNRKTPICAPEDYKPFNADPKNIAPLANYGSEYVFKVTGTTHNDKGVADSNPKNADKYIRYYTDKIEKNVEDISISRKYNLEDAEEVIITFGCSTRTALAAMDTLRKQGEKVGVLQLVTVWPLDKKSIKEVLKKAKSVMVPELNLGQLKGEIQKYNSKNIPIIGVNKVNGEAIEPQEIITAIEEVANNA